MRTRSIKSLRLQAWKLQSELIRREEGGVCYTCGKIQNWKDCHCGHFKHLDSLDFYRPNLHCQCCGCNTYRHGNLANYAEHLVRDYGKSILQEILTLGHQIKKFTSTELEQIIDDRKKKIIALDNRKEI